MEYILGVDGGGSKTVVMIANGKGEILIRKEGSATNYKSIGKEAAQKNLNEVILGTIKKLANKDKDLIFSSSCFGLAGNDHEEDYKIYEDIINNLSFKRLINFKKNIICNDAKLGLSACSNNKNKVIIICGTGSNCYGINEEGIESSSNGWDYILGDQGSGFSIGIRALRAIAKGYDGREENSPILVENIFNSLGFNSIHELERWVYFPHVSKDNISGLAAIVCKAAEEGDSKSIEILKDEAYEVVITVTSVVNKLSLQEKKFDLVLMGSLFKCRRFFKEVFVNELNKKFKYINFVTLEKEPVEGAIELALLSLG